MINNSFNSKKEYNIGIIVALLSSSLWGFLPIYWKSLDPISPYVIIFYRVLLVAIVSFFIGWKKYGIKKVCNLFIKRDRKELRKFFFIGVLIAFNWSVYIWAVNSGYIVQTSIGYYIEPLIVCLIGIVFFREKVTKFNLTAMSLATIGMVVLIWHYRQLPSIALVIAVTFAIYAAMKKSVNLEPEISLFYETIFLAPVALIVVIYIEIKGVGAVGIGSHYQYGLLMLSGIMTALPLGLFGVAARKLSMITLGITSYISPSLALVLGVIVYKEGFDFIQFMAFLIVWIGLIIFTLGEYLKK